MCFQLKAKTLLFPNNRFIFIQFHYFRKKFFSIPQKLITFNIGCKSILQKYLKFEHYSIQAKINPNIVLEVV